MPHHPSLASYPAPDLHWAAAYGCRWTSTFPLPCFEPLSTDPPPPGFPLHELEIVHRPDAPERTLVRRGKHLWQADDGLRYVADDGAILDSFDGSRVVVSGLPPAGELPGAFYGTVTGTLLAWRGLIPIHGSAVEWNGQGVLLCGPSGAGKSSATAALISRGARLLSDDLSVLHAPVPGEPLTLYAGRTFIRLFPALADALATRVPLGELPTQSGAKRAVTPPRLAPWIPVPLRGVVYLGAGPAGAGSPEAGLPVPELQAQLYRPQAMQLLPGRRRRLSSLVFAAPRLRSLQCDTGPVKDRDAFQRLAERMVHLLDEAGL